MRHANRAVAISRPAKAAPSSRQRAAHTRHAAHAGHAGRFARSNPAGGRRLCHLRSRRGRRRRRRSRCERCWRRWRRTALCCLRPTLLVFRRRTCRWSRRGSWSRAGPDHDRRRWRRLGRGGDIVLGVRKGRLASGLLARRGSVLATLPPGHLAWRSPGLTQFGAHDQKCEGDDDDGGQDQSQAPARQRRQRRHRTPREHEQQDAE